MIRRSSIAAIAAGVVAQLAGLAVDSVLHARDAGLAEREGVLSLSNPGHLLFALGLALTVLGVCGLLLAPALSERRRGGLAGLAFAALPAAAVLALTGGAFAVAARSGGMEGHSHAAADHDHAEAARQAAITSSGDSTTAGHSHAAAAAPSGDPGDLSRHDHGQEINVSWEQLRDIDGMLTRAKAATEKYQDVAVARADGYTQVTQVVPGLGAHFVQPAFMAAGIFDVEHPPILLYDRGSDGRWELVGLSWTLPKKEGAAAPPSPFGALATWHYHTDLCFGLRGGAPTVAATDAAACRSAGGVFLNETPWMMHAWLFRPSPEGVFSHQNSTITGAPGRALR